VSTQQPRRRTTASRAGTNRVPVIGLAGGIGSGKSAVARLLAERGAVISDSDTQAKALLREPSIATILTRWWGKSILGADKLPDRAAIAAIVFKDPVQRARLEGLIHPLLHSQRSKAVAAAAKSNPPAPLFVIDAPLLFEARLDRECDAVLFVDAPRTTRLARVAANRKWHEAELTRREAAQLALDTKRARSTFVIDNSVDGPDGTLHLNRQLDELWPKLTAAAGGTRSARRA
jgi:dephospho-CoA kinase